MNHNPQAPATGSAGPVGTPHPLQHLDRLRRRVLTVPELRDHGIGPAEAEERCLPGGGWQELLPGVLLLHPGPPSGEDRLRAALLYAGHADGRPAAEEEQVPPQPGAGERRGGQALVTGLAALACHGFACTPPLEALNKVDVLVPRGRRLRSTGCARVTRTHRLPLPETVRGVPLAPVARAVADAVALLGDGAEVHALLTEAVREGHCEPTCLVRELTTARLMARPHVVRAVDTVLTESRSYSEERLLRMVREHRLPEPLWNVTLRLPGGPEVGGVDAYWPEYGVALELDSDLPARRAPVPEGEPEGGLRRDQLERLGVALVRTAAAALREEPEQQAVVVRTALMAGADRDPLPYLVVLPR